MGKNVFILTTIILTIILLSGCNSQPNPKNLTPTIQPKTSPASLLTLTSTLAIPISTLEIPTPTNVGFGMKEVYRKEFKWDATKKDWLEEPLVDIAWSADGQSIIWLTKTSVYTYSLPSFQLAFSSQTKADDTASTQSLSLDGERSLIQTHTINYRAGDLKIYETKSGTLLEHQTVGRDCIQEDLALPIEFIDKDQFVVIVSDVFQKRPTRLNIWTDTPLRCQKSFRTKVPDMFYSIDLSPDKDFLAYSGISSYSGNVLSGETEMRHGSSPYIGNAETLIWNIENNKALCNISSGPSRFRPSDGLLAVYNLQTGNLNYWDVEECKLIRDIPWREFSSEQDMLFTKDGKYLITARGSIQVWDADTAELQFESKGSDSLLRLSPNGLSPDGRYLISLSYSQVEVLLQVWQITFP